MRMRGMRGSFLGLYRLMVASLNRTDAEACKNYSTETWTRTNTTNADKRVADSCMSPVSSSFQRALFLNAAALTPGGSRPAMQAHWSLYDPQPPTITSPCAALVPHPLR